jgi:CRP/FNR family transcriptional regulator, cyclic AMP receptor protein
MTSSVHKSVFHDAILQCLKSIVIFSDLTADELNFMADQMHVLRTVSGGAIFKEGDPGDFVCFVVEGTVQVLKTTGGKEKTIAQLTTGQSIGEMSVVGDFPRSATVRSISDATLLTLKRDRLNKISEDHPRIGMKIFKAIARMLSHHLRKTSENLFELMPPE